MKNITGLFAFATLLLAGCAMQDQGDASPSNSASQVRQDTELGATTLSATTNNAAGDSSKALEGPFFCCPVPCPGTDILAQEEAQAQPRVWAVQPGLRCCEACGP